MLNQKQISEVYTLLTAEIEIADEDQLESFKEWFEAQDLEELEYETVDEAKDDVISSIYDTCDSFEEFKQEVLGA